MYPHPPSPTVLLSSKGGVLAAFVAVHLLFLLLLIPRISAGDTYGDVSLYREWAFKGLTEGTWQGVDVPWVYPIAAMFPMLAATVFGPGQYMFGWFLLCTVLNLGAVTSTAHSSRRSVRLAGRVSVAASYRRSWDRSAFPGLTAFLRRSW